MNNAAPRKRIDFEKANRADLLAIVERDGVEFQERGNARTKHGNCPKCGGKDRFTVSYRDGLWYWFCNQCYQRVDGRLWHSPIDYLMWRDGIGVIEAANILNGDSVMTEMVVRQWAAARPTPPPPELPSEQKIEAWVKALIKSKTANEFLRGKGVTEGVAHYYRLGYNAHYWAGPAITIPIYADGQIRSVQHRLLQPKPGEARYKNLPGAGAWPMGIDEVKGCEDLIIVEGSIKKMIVEVMGTTLGIVAKEAFMPVMGVTDLKAHKQAWYARFAHLKRVYLCLDPDVNPYTVSWIPGLIEAMPSGSVYAVALPMKCDDLLLKPGGVKAFEAGRRAASALRMV